MNFSNSTTDSMPERVHITQQIELRKKQQDEADKRAEVQRANRQTSPASK